MIGHFPEAEAGELEFPKEAAGASCELAAVAQADRGRIPRHPVERVDGGEPLLDRFGHVEDGCFERLALVPLTLDEPFSLLLFGDGRFFCHVLFPSGRPFLALLAVGVFLIDYVDAALAANDLVAFGRVCFNGSSDFHPNYLIRKSTVIPQRPICLQGSLCILISCE